MLVYGDQRERVSTRMRIAELEARREATRAIPGCVERHGALCGLFIDWAGLVQGIADAQFAAQREDDQNPTVHALMKELILVARQVLTSWESDFRAAPIRPLAVPSHLPSTIEVKLPEGFAFYALYPEAYALAARRLRLSGPPLVIGLRSIGTGLAAMVAAALGVQSAVTLRPEGDPFDRHIVVSEKLEKQLLARADTHYIIVDEGPGLSGSSFGAVADWLEVRGVDPARIAFLPGHGGALGPRASDAHRQRWASAQRPVMTGDELLAEQLPRWVEKLTGPIEGPLEDISGGAWRSRRYRDEREWPAVQPSSERRKFLARSGGSTWLVKFAGLGSIGEDKLDLARKLEGFIPQPLGLVHGWLIERWHEEAMAGRPNADELAAYLARRVSLPARQGASLKLLRAMIARNLPAARWDFDLARLQPLVRPVVTDGRLAAHEWLRLPCGKPLKCDALDHHAAHDLVGCQDIAWDVAAASVELSLDEVLPVDRDLLAFYRLAYLAFRVGVHRMAAEGLAEWPAEQARNLAAAQRYEAMV
ncbi:MAG: hypothetical protein ABR588_06055 [Sphingomicrobium sp.]